MTTITTLAQGAAVSRPPDEARSASPPSRVESQNQGYLKNRRGRVGRLLRSRRAPIANSPLSPAFTLIEIMVVLAIAAMMTTVFAIGYTKLADRKPTTPDAIFWNAVTAARRQALFSGREVRLAYTPAVTSDSANTPAGLIMTWDNTPTGNPNTAIDDPVPPGEQQFPFENMDDTILEFLSTQKGTQSVLIGGEVVETQTIPFMTFYGDGTCTPVRIQIRRNAGAAYTLNIDPWTCAQMLTADTTTQ